VTGIDDIITTITTTGTTECGTGRGVPAIAGVIGGTGTRS
jgi:hypothetical protein